MTTTDEPPTKTADAPLPTPLRHEPHTRPVTYRDQRHTGQLLVWSLVSPDEWKRHGEHEGGFVDDDALAHVGIHDGDSVSIWCPLADVEAAAAGTIAADAAARYLVGDVVLAEPEDTKYAGMPAYLAVLSAWSGGYPLLCYAGPAPWGDRAVPALERARILGYVTDVTHYPTRGRMECLTRWGRSDDRLLRWSRSRRAAVHRP